MTKPKTEMTPDEFTASLEKMTIPQLKEAYKCFDWDSRKTMMEAAYLAGELFHRGDRKSVV